MVGVERRFAKDARCLTWLEGFWGEDGKLIEKQSGTARGFRKLIAWQKAHQLVVLVYEMTSGYPKSEVFGLTAQMRRAAVSIPANIVEGYARRHKAEFRQGLNIAKGSLGELEYYIELSRDLGYLSNDSYASLSELLDECGRVLNGLLKSQL